MVQGWIMQAEIRLGIFFQNQKFKERHCTLILTIKWPAGCYQRTRGVLDRLQHCRPCVTTQWQDVHLRLLHFQDCFLATTISARRTIDICKCHTTKIKQNHYPSFYEKIKTITARHWKERSWAQSPVMSPAEHVWDMLNQRICWHENTPENLITRFCLKKWTIFHRCVVH